MVIKTRRIALKTHPIRLNFAQKYRADERYYLSVQKQESHLELRRVFLVGIVMTQPQLLPTKIATSLWLIPSSEAHQAFLHEIFIQNRKPLWLAAGLAAGWIDQLLFTQAHIQQQTFDQNAADQFSYIIAAKGQWVGRLLVRANDDGIHIIDIALLPDHQNQGIGQEVINYLKKQAAARKLPLTLNADETSRAYEWYLDCGFTTTQTSGLNRSMAWNVNLCAPSICD